MNHSPTITLQRIVGWTEITRRADGTWAWTVTLDADPDGEAVGGWTFTLWGASFKAWRVRRGLR